MAARPLKKLVLRTSIVVVAIALGDVLVQRCALDDGELLGRRIAPFDPPLFAAHQRERVERYRDIANSGIDPRSVSDFDPDLGWSPRPGTSDGLYAYDERGARIGARAVPRERTPGVRRVVALGCSFTFGLEVAGHESWPALVDAARDDLEVVNLAFGAYGLDQCFLRYRRDGAPEAPDEVWLGIFPGAALRNVTTFHPNLSHWTSVVHVKPRFHFDMLGELAPVLSPARSMQELVALFDDQPTFLARVGAHDLWVQRAPAAYAPRGTSAWHHSAIARVALTWHERRERESEPWIWDATSEVARLEDALVRAIAAEVSGSGARFRALIVPDRRELEPLARGEQACWSALASGWREAGIDVFDAASALIAANAHADACFWASEGHYSTGGNRVVATAFAEHLARQP